MSRMRILPTLMALSCAQLAFAPYVVAGPHDALIAKHATAHGVPESLIRRVIRIESGGNPRAVSKGNYGLMQIRYGTARALGYRGTPQGLLDADTNMNFAVKYLAGAYRAAGCNESRAVSYYQRGYYGARRAKCPVPVPSASQIAERAEDKNSAARPVARIERAMDTVIATPEPSASPDVLTPRVVQTQTFSRPAPEPKPMARPDPAAPKLAATSAAPAAEPAAQTVAAAQPMARVEAKSAPQPLAEPAQPMARVEAKSAPQPPVEPAPEPVQPAPPAEMTMKDFLTQPITRAKPEPASPPKEMVVERTSEPTSMPATAVSSATDAKANVAWATAASQWQPPLRSTIAKAEPNVVPIPLARPGINPFPPAVAALDPEPAPAPAVKRALPRAQDANEEKPVHTRKHKRARSLRTVRDAERITAVQQSVTPERTSRVTAAPTSRVTPARTSRQRAAAAAQPDPPERHRP